MRNTRLLDAQGRVILPNHIRKELGLEGGSAVDVRLEDNGTITIQPAENRCVICGEKGDGSKVFEVKIGSCTKHICLDCAKAIVEKSK